MTRIAADQDRCEGHGLCEWTAPEVFRISDDGKVEAIFEGEVPSELQAQAEAGVQVCPVAALRTLP